jgi:GT2 family glycosyltransferase
MALSSLSGRCQRIVAVRKQADRIGFGRNVNFGVRHTSGKYVLVLNDDVYLAPDAVIRMMECMKPRTGVVGQLLRYPDGTIYHAGKIRMGNGGIGFPHVDHRQREASIKTPMEMENTNGASFLFRRRAFYDADGYDDGFFFYAEDDDICMKIRKAGWGVWYTPLATGIHDEHQESRNWPERMAVMQQSNARFGQKWARYFQHNLGNPGLGNFDYLRTKK